MINNLLLSLALLLITQQAVAESPQPPPIDDSVSQGLRNAEAEIAADQQAQQRLKQQVSYCAPCHGQNGQPSLAIYPNLAGKDVDYLFNKMQWYKQQSVNGQIKPPMMLRFSDAELYALAQYFARFKD